ncbi:hypothetical protein D9615_002576 [Tricholomella constricta]|uniref:Transcriptional coactivator p15 (PC4) C-terminal domain-containing protein n=1 Tax=Tricholomella constricta TaxID=117010 RepID=A0A8H5HMN0_9AGAR|nr:hypothetical protein D9615_002576 [Tricholomella constricta]
MAKRKVSSDDDHDNSDYAGSPANDQPKSRSKRAAQKKKAVKKEESDSESPFVKAESDDDEDEDEPPLAKKPKTEKATDKKKPKNASKASGSTGITVETTSEGDKYIELGKKKRATVRSFKGTPLIDIREFYGADGDEKPGKKGISLTMEQWETLKSSMSTLDELFATVKKK